MDEIVDEIDAMYKSIDLLIAKRRRDWNGSSLKDLRITLENG